MEVLAFAGVSTAMFLDVPSPERLARLKGVEAIGIAGISRSKDPAWMDANLPRIFDALASFGAPILHYKTCSTFDSAPHLGSIGRAIELGLKTTGATWCPLVVGAPAIGRYQMFGNLFASWGGASYRLDRHPVMSCHPATPMHEADLLRHLDAQTRLPKALVDWPTLLAGEGLRALLAARNRGARIISFDAFDEATLVRVGEVLWEATNRGPIFAAGSQGIEYALVAYFRAIGRLPNRRTRQFFLPSVPLLVVSGSCSETTARQIATAERAGFQVLELNAAKAIDPLAWEAELLRAEATMNAFLGEGAHVLVATARGPGDPALERFRNAMAQTHVPEQEVHARIGAGLGRLVRAGRVQHRLPRVIFSGGDTSGHAMLTMGAEALEPIAPLAPGVPLLRVHANDPRFDRMEVALKGGQMGDDQLFIRAANGAPPI